MLLSFKKLCRMSLSPKKIHVAVSNLVGLESSPPPPPPRGFWKGYFASELITSTVHRYSYSHLQNPQIKDDLDTIHAFWHQKSINAYTGMYSLCHTVVSRSGGFRGGGVARPSLSGQDLTPGKFCYFQNFTLACPPFSKPGSGTESSL